MPLLLLQGQQQAPQPRLQPLERQQRLQEVSFLIQMRSPVASRDRIFLSVHDLSNPTATQVATVVAVSTATAAAATTAAVVNATPEPILSICGLANPYIRSGRMVMTFEGLPRRFDDREAGLVENLVLQSYNELTLGTNVAVTGCLDPLAREMQSIKIVNQTLFLGTNVMDPNFLEVVFEAQVSCDRCSDSSPLFSEDQVQGTVESDEESTNTTDLVNPGNRKTSMH